MNEEIDNIDRKIISILLNEGRKSFNEISLIVGVSTGTVANRIKKLLKKGVIKKFTVDLDWKKLGFKVFAILLIEAELKKLSSITEKLYSYPEVNEIYTCMVGTPSIVVFIRVNAIEDLSFFIQDKIASLEGVKNFKSIIVTDSRRK